MVIANFKSNKTTKEVLAWIEEVGKTLNEEKVQDPIIVCPQFPALAPARQLVDDKQWGECIKLGAQDVSAYGPGTYTGAVTAEALVGLINYVIIGHSERRQYFHETKEDMLKKMANAKAASIKSIYCVSDETLEEVKETGDDAIIAYEPLAAIGSGKPATTDQIEKAVSLILQYRTNWGTIMYGGSVNAQTAPEILSVNGINGFLVGSASLEAQSFLAIYYAIRQSR